MKMFRSEQRKDHRRDLAEEERQALEADAHVSPGKVSSTSRMVYAPRQESFAEGVDQARSGHVQGVARRRWIGPNIGDGALFGTSRSGGREGPMLGAGPAAMEHLAHAPNAPIQGKGMGERPEPSALHLEASGSGEALPEDVRARMETSLGMDFSGVRIHVGNQAPSVGALAFTRGTDIFFAPGEYRPESVAGQELLGHELAHVAQQSQGRVAPSWRAGDVAVNDDPALEREADILGARAARAQVETAASGAPGMHARVPTSSPASTRAPTTSREPAPSPGPVQMRKNKADRYYSENYPLSGMGVTEAHVFDGEVRGTDPKGLHAYDGNGGLPGGVKMLARVGNPNKVHVIIWTMGAADRALRAKWSGMFPESMPKSIVSYYLTNGPGPVSGEKVGGKGQRPGTGWGTIEVAKAGATKYPLSGVDWKSACEQDASGNWQVKKDGKTYKIVNS